MDPGQKHPPAPWARLTFIGRHFRPGALQNKSWTIHTKLYVGDAFGDAGGQGWGRGDNTGLAGVLWYRDIRECHELHALPGSTGIHRLTRFMSHDDLGSEC